VGAQAWERVNIIFAEPEKREARSMRDNAKKAWEPEIVDVVAGFVWHSHVRPRITPSLDYMALRPTLSATLDARILEKPP
jgi:hypothetical protein